MAIIKTGLSKIGAKIVTPARREEETAIPFVPALDLLEGRLSDEEAAAIGLALSLIFESQSQSLTWATTALIEGISTRDTCTLLQCP